MVTKLESSKEKPHESLITHLATPSIGVPASDGSAADTSFATSRNGTYDQSSKTEISTPSTVGITVGSVAGGLGLLALIYFIRAWLNRKRVGREDTNSVRSPSFYSRPDNLPQRIPPYDGSHSDFPHSHFF